jgi:hypothetical protein
VRLPAVLLAGAVLAAGCGGDDMTRFEDDGIAFSHPNGWERMQDVEAGDDGDGLVAAFEGDSGVDGAPVRALAFNQPREPGSVAQYGKFVALSRPGDANGELVEDGSIDVPGAEGAWRVVVDYRVQPKGGGDPVPARSVDILPVNGDRQYRLTVTGPSEAVNGDQVQQLIDSFEITSQPTA